MEMQSFATVNIQTFDPNDNVLKVSVPTKHDEVSVDVLHSKVCKDIGLKKGSWRYFGIFHGLNTPLKKYKASETILLPAKDVSFQKWCFDPKEEKRMVKSDSRAAHLICLQNQHNIIAGNLVPAEAVKQKLDEFLDPSFPTEEQYVATCQSLDNYFSVQVRDCSLYEATVLQGVHFPRNSVLCLFVAKHGLKVTSGDGLSVSLSWHNISKWTWNKEEATLTYTVHLTELSAPSVLHIRTIQSDYLLSATMEAVWTLMTEDDDSPVFHASMISSLPDGSTQWSNCIHRYNTNS